MVGTGANRTPLTKVHPVLLGKQNNEGGSSLLAQHRQMHNERMQYQTQRSGPGQGPPNQGGPPQGQVSSFIIIGAP